MFNYLTNKKVRDFNYCIWCILTIFCTYYRGTQTRICHMCICVKKLLFPCHPVIGGDRTSLINAVSLISNLLMTQVANTEQNKTKTKKHPKNQHSALWFYIGYKYTGCYPKKGKKKHLYFLKSCNCVHYSNQLLNNVAKRWGKKSKTPSLI